MSADNESRNPKVDTVRIRRPDALRVVSEPAKGEPQPRFFKSREAMLGETLDGAGATPADQEFPVGTDVLDPVSRRGFVQLMSAGIAVTTTACYRPKQKVVPYVRKPPEVTPGVASHYASALNHEGYGFGVLVETHEARPTKVEGNPEHADTRGGRSTAADQAALLGLYDHDRARAMRLSGRSASWVDIKKFIASRVEALSTNGGRGLHFLLDPSTSPLLGDLRQRIQTRLPEATLTSWSPVSDETGREGTELVFGQPLDARHDLEKARVIVSLDADFLDDGVERVSMSYGFAQSREPGEHMSRLYVVEPTLSTTGMSADHRMRVRGADVVAVAQALASELSKSVGQDVLGGLAALPMARAGVTVDAKWISALARDIANTADAA